MLKKPEAPPDAKLNARIPTVLLRQLKVRCVERDLKLQEAVREAVELWLKKA